METEYDKNIRIRKELYTIDKNIHDLYIGNFRCMCTASHLCKEYVDCMSHYEMKRYINLSHLSQEQKNWVLKKLLLEIE